MPLHTFSIEFFLIDSANTTRTVVYLADSQEQALSYFQDTHPLGTMLTLEQID